MLRPAMVAIALLLSRALDLWSTYRVTPSLRGESNPVVRVLGAGWTGFLISNLAFVVGLVAAAWYASRHAPPLPATRGLDFRSFVRSLWFAERPAHAWWHAWWRFPSRARVFWCWLGAVLPLVMVAVSLAAAVHNVWMPADPSWRRASFAGIYAVAVAAWLVAHTWFLKSQYRRYLESQPGVNAVRRPRDPG